MLTILAPFDLYTFYFGMKITLFVLMLLLSIAMIIIVLIQQGTNNNLGAISGGGDSFFGKNKAQTMESKLKRATIGISMGLLLCSILFFVFVILGDLL